MIIVFKLCHDKLIGVGQMRKENEAIDDFDCVSVAESFELEPKDKELYEPRAFGTDEEEQAALEEEWQQKMRRELNELY